MYKQKEKSKFIFCNQLADIVRENDYIPRRINENEHLKLYHRYWSSFTESFCKVLQIYTVKNREYYSVKMHNSLFAEIPYPLSKDYIYELLVDYKKIKNSWIINNPNLGSLTGAEIRYWFFVKNIDLNDPEFSGFWSYLNYSSKSCISDNKYYFVKSFNDKNSVKKCFISIDKSKR